MSDECEMMTAEMMRLAAFCAGEMEKAEGVSSFRVYVRDFERPLIEATKAYYAERSERLFGETSVVEFARYVSYANVRRN